MQDKWTRYSYRKLSPVGVSRAVAREETSGSRRLIRLQVGTVQTVLKFIEAGLCMNLAADLEHKGCFFGNLR